MATRSVTRVEEISAESLAMVMLLSPRPGVASRDVTCGSMMCDVICGMTYVRCVKGLMSLTADCDARNDTCAVHEHMARKPKRTQYEKKKSYH